MEILIFTDVDLKEGSQAYGCKSCEKWYRETTGTPLYNIQKKENGILI